MPTKITSKLAKRIIDLSISSLLIIVLSPILLLISLAIKISSKGPILFKQARLGLNGTPFTIYKFRTMVLGAEKLTQGLFNYRNDPRVTRIGSILRATSLDELPQLINVIKGDMSLVGPRPPVTYELGDYENFSAALKKRFTMKPGITGYAQINGRNELNWDQKIVLDNQYIDDFNKRGSLLDLKILCITIIKVFFMEGSYEKEENTAMDRAKQSTCTLTLSHDLLHKLSSQYGESFYLLNTEKFINNFKDFLAAFRKGYKKTFIAYSYKTNYIPCLCKLVNTYEGYAEVVSNMEYALALKIGVNPKKIIVNGPYKTKKDLTTYIQNKSIINLDSLYEINLVEEIAAENPNTIIEVGLRCNFTLNTDKNFVSRFGMDVNDPPIAQKINNFRSHSNIRIVGLHCHYPNRDLDSYKSRIENLLTIAKLIFGESTPQYLDIGGGYFGHLPNNLSHQFNIEIPTYEQYATIITKGMNDTYGHLPKEQQPILFLEPGSAIAGDVMKFVTTIKDIKNIRSKWIAMTSGSKFNIGLLSSSVNLPMQVFSPDNAQSKSYESIDISGYTCIEKDYLYKDYTGSLSIGDYLVFDNAGSYSIVFKPPFILPNVPVLELLSDASVNEIKRQETVDDIFQTYVI